MKYQTTANNCGANAVVNACRVFGVKVREDLVAANAGTTGKGTTEHGLKQALLRAGFVHEELAERKYSIAETWLLDRLKHGWAVILCTESGNHWEVCFGMLGDRVVVFDGQTGAFNKAVNGVHVLKVGRQLREYWEPSEMKRYAIATRPEKS